MKRKKKRPQDWSGNEKFTAVVETEGMNEEELADYCGKDLTVDQLKNWKETCLTEIRKGPKVDSEKRDLRKEVKALKAELNLKNKALAEVRALMVLKEESESIPESRGSGRGRLFSPDQRQKILNSVEKAVSKGCREEKACDALGINVRTLKNWQKRGDLSDGRTTREFEPANKLSKEERAKILSLVNSKKYRNLSPDQIVPILVDEGEYLASESTIYRILREEKMLAHRQTSRPAKRQRPDPFMTNGPNQVRTWDITYLPTTVKGVYLYLYMIIDIYSRKIVGWEVHNEESSQNAAKLIAKTHRSEGAKAETVLHSDNGSPMKGATMLATLYRLGILPSFSRPSVSNDNPYSEALFRTLKYRPEYPHEPFEDVEAARKWVTGFVCWYNMEHRHSALKFVTPHQRHEGEHHEIFAKRKRMYEKARKNNPKRWAGKIRNWDLDEEVYLNPGRAPSTPSKKKSGKASSKNGKTCGASSKKDKVA